MTQPDTSAPLPEAFYLPAHDPETAGDDTVADVHEFESTVATTSPWDETMQHGGPPAALLVRACERVRPDTSMPLARITVDMLGPIPQGRIRTEAEIVRPGKRIEMIQAKLWANDKLAVTATAWRVRADQGMTSEVANEPDAPELPGPQEQRYFPSISPDWGYGRALEWRFVEGSYDTLGPASVWAQPRIPLVAGEETTPTQAVAIIADSANGLSGELPQDKWLFVPPSLSLTFAREPRSSWVNVTARTTVTGDGRGMTDGELYDTEGLVGAVTQPLVIARM